MEFINNNKKVFVIALIGLILIFLGIILSFISKNSMKPKGCTLIEGSSLEIGSKYECDLGDGVKRNLYVLSVSRDENTVDLLFEHNITEGTKTPSMSHDDALKYFDSGDVHNLIKKWHRAIKVDLPSIQAIVDAAGVKNWNYEKAGYDDHSYFGTNDGPDPGSKVKSKYNWLYNYTRECGEFGCSKDTSLSEPESWGYWAREKVVGNDERAWSVDRTGFFHGIIASSKNSYGVRPVVTVGIEK